MVFCRYKFVRATAISIDKLVGLLQHYYYRSCARYIALRYSDAGNKVKQSATSRIIFPLLYWFVRK